MEGSLTRNNDIAPPSAVGFGDPKPQLQARLGLFRSTVVETARPLVRLSHHLRIFYDCSAFGYPISSSRLFSHIERAHTYHKHLFN